MKKLDTLTPEERQRQRELEHARYLRRKAELGIKRENSRVCVRDLAATRDENREIREAEAAAERQAAAERKEARHQASVEHEKAYKQTDRYKAMNRSWQRRFLERHPGYTQWLADKRRALDELHLGS